MLKEKIGEAAMFEQTAEECVELSHVCMKMARKLRGENFTPKTFEELNDNLHEEIADVLICLEELEIDNNFIQMWEEKKKARLKTRLGIKE